MTDWLARIREYPPPTGLPGLRLTVNGNLIPEPIQIPEARTRTSGMAKDKRPKGPSA